MISAIGPQGLGRTVKRSLDVFSWLFSFLTTRHRILLLVVFGCSVIEDDVDVIIPWLSVAQAFSSLRKVGRASSI